MKNYIAFLICVLSLPAKSQENNESILPSRHEISIVAEDIFAKPVYIEVAPIYWDYLPYYYNTDNNVREVPTPNIGLGYKFHFKNSALRAKLSLGTGSNESNGENNLTDSESSYLNLGISSGYEFHTNIERVQIFYGADIFFRYDKYDSESTNYYETQTYKSETILKTSSYGICPILGIKYFLTSALSLSTELKYSLETYKGDMTNKYTGATDSKTKLSGSDTRFGPLGQISINVHF